MLVTVLGFGSVWERRFGKDPKDLFRFSNHAAFYNTTGISLRGKKQYRWRVGGKVRFNGGSGFLPHQPQHSLNKVFECDEPEQRNDWIQMLCKRKLLKPELPDWFLFAIRSSQIGYVATKQREWKSPGTYLLSYSAFQGEQEFLMLMKPDSWVRGENGLFVSRPHAKQFWSANLVPEGNIVR